MLGVDGDLVRIRASTAWRRRISSFNLAIWYLRRAMRRSTFARAKLLSRSSQKLKVKKSGLFKCFANAGFF